MLQMDGSWVSFYQVKEVHLQRLLYCTTLLPDILNKAKQKYEQLARLPRLPWPGGRLGAGSLSILPGRVAQLLGETPAPTPLLGQHGPGCFGT